MSERNDGSEGNDDDPHAPAPGQRSVEDIFEAFGDGMGDSRDRVIEEEGDKEEEMTEEERQEREERERIEALTSSGVSHVLDTVERQQNIIEELFRAERLKKGLKDEDDE